MKIKLYLAIAALFCLILACPATTFATEAAKPILMGEETIGNKPFTIHNYKDVPNILPVANNKSRVYHTWVNGDERFYYQANSDQLNQLMIDYSKLKGKKEILVLPQAEKVSTFDRKQSFGFNCQMHLVGGIAKHIGGKPKGNIYWPADPLLTIHVTPKTDLDKLNVPAGVKLVSLAEIKARYKSGLDSTDKTVRGWGIGFFANVDTYDGESLKTISELAIDKDDWVALNALSNIEKFGPKAKDLLPRLEVIIKTGVAANAKRAKELIPKIKAACETSAAAKFASREKLFRQQADQAEAFVDRIRGL